MDLGHVLIDLRKSREVEPSAYGHRIGFGVDRIQEEGVDVKVLDTRTTFLIQYYRILNISGWIVHAGYN